MKSKKSSEYTAFENLLRQVIQSRNVKPLEQRSGSLTLANRISDEKLLPSQARDCVLESKWFGSVLRHHFIQPYQLRAGLC
jgi:hypothetical protein